MNEITIDPKSLREHCISYGALLRIVSPGENPNFDGAVGLAAYLLYGTYMGNPIEASSIALTAFRNRKMKKKDGTYIDFPAWGEADKQVISEGFADSFFPLYCAFLAKELGIAPEEALGPVFFFSGAVKEDIEDGYCKEEDDPLYVKIREQVAPIFEQTPMEDLLTLFSAIESL